MKNRRKTKCAIEWTDSHKVYDLVLDLWILEAKRIVEIAERA